jgi:hypothetical protein
MKIMKKLPRKYTSGPFIIQFYLKEEDLGRKAKKIKQRKFKTFRSKRSVNNEWNKYQPQ